MTAPNRKRLSGVALFVVGLPAFGQGKVPVPASAPASSVQQPNAIPPSDPAWSVADVGIALIIGLIVGYLIGARRATARQRTSHA